MNNTKEVSIFTWLIKKIKNRYLRRKIKWKRFKESKFRIKREELGIEKQRAIELFITLIKNKTYALNHSPESKSRFVDSDLLWACMYSAKDNRNYIINIIDGSIPETPHSHEFLIPEEQADLIMDIFDAELEKRFKALEFENKQVLISGIDKLIIKIKETK